MNSSWNWWRLALPLLTFAATFGIVLLPIWLHTRRLRRQLAQFEKEGKQDASIAMVGGRARVVPRH